MEAKPLFRRKNFLINKHLQLRFALVSSILLLASTAGVSLLLMWIFRSAQVEHLSPSNSLVDLSTHIIAGMIIANGIVAFGLSIYFSHCIAGPLYRVQKGLQAILGEEGPVPPVVLRKEDQLQEIVALLNEVIEDVNQQRKKGKKSKSS